jgi:SAM-dependent methyltransferase
MNRREIKTFAFRVIQLLRIVPSVWMFRNPFKIHEFLEVTKDSRLRNSHNSLDLGCGKGFQTQILARWCAKAVGVDTSKTAISMARRFLRHSCVEKKVQFICNRIENAELPDCSFDRVFSFCTLEHIPDLATVLSEIYRLLKPGGELHISLDSLANLSSRVLIEKHRRDHSVVQYFTVASIKSQLETFGLEPFEIFPIFTSDFSRREFERRIEEEHYGYGLMKRVSVYRVLRDWDQRNKSSKGIMLIARARRPS